MHNHKYSLNEIDGLMPWEKEVYLSLIVEQLKEEKAAAAQQG
jgi:hypothetical protein